MHELIGLGRVVEAVQEGEQIFVEDFCLRSASDVNSRYSHSRVGLVELVAELPVPTLQRMSPGNACPRRASSAARRTVSGRMISYVRPFCITPCWWIPASWKNALRPTNRLVGLRESADDVGQELTRVKISRVLMPHVNATACGRTCPAITISSSAAPARSPMPFTCGRPALRPRSRRANWRQRAPGRRTVGAKTTLSLLGTRSRTVRNIAAYSAGIACVAHVSGRLIVVAPVWIATSTIRHRNSRSERLASSAENSTSSVKRRARSTAARARSTHSS